MKTAASSENVSAQASVASDNEALISDTESVGEAEEEKKIEERVQAMNLNSSSAQEAEFSEEEDAKSEAFKKKGNELFKGKYFHLKSHSIYIV